jgi:hypothetical protein
MVKVPVPLGGHSKQCRVGVKACNAHANRFVCEMGSLTFGKRRKARNGTMRLLKTSHSQPQRLIQFVDRARR